MTRDELKTWIYEQADARMQTVAERAETFTNAAGDCERAALLREVLREVAAVEALAGAYEQASEEEN